MLPKSYSRHFTIELPLNDWVEYRIDFGRTGDICFTLVEGSPRIYAALRDPLDFYGEFPASSGDVDLDLPAFKVLNRVAEEVRGWLASVQPEQFSVSLLSPRRVGLYERMVRRLAEGQPYQLLAYGRQIVGYRLPRSQSLVYQ